MSVPITIDVTYAELVNLINTSGLYQGVNYLLTDYKTVHYMFDGYTRLDDINTGELEPLLLTASSVNSLYPKATSTLYPQDTIWYDWKTTPWMADIAFADAENVLGTVLEPDYSGVTLIPNYKGVIYRRLDNKLNNQLGYDFRNVKFRRWKRNDPVWSDAVTYALSDKVQVAGVGVYFSLVADNLNNLTTDDTKWCKIIDYAVTEYWNYDSASSPDPLDFIDCYTFQGFDVYNTYELNVRDNVFGNPNDDYFAQNGIGSSLDGSVFYLSGNSVGGQQYKIYGNKIGEFFEFNTVGGGFFANTICSKFQSNVISNGCISNIIGTGFYGNIIGNDYSGNTIGNNYNGNIIGNDYSGNTIGNYFNGNIIGNGAESNTIGNYFQNSVIGNYFYANTVKDVFIGSGTDFSSATHIYAEYNCELFTTSTGTKKLWYVDGNTNLLTIVDANA